MLQGVGGHDGDFAQRGFDTGASRKAVKVARVQLARAVGRNDEVHLPVKAAKLRGGQAAVVRDALLQARHIEVCGRVASAHDMHAQLRQVCQVLHGNHELREAFVGCAGHVAFGHKADIERVFALAVAGAVAGEARVKVVGVDHDTLHHVHGRQRQGVGLRQLGQIALHHGLGDNDVFEQRAGQHAQEFAVALGIAQAQAATGVKVEHKRYAVAGEVVQVGVSVVEEGDVGQFGSSQPLGHVAADAAGMVWVEGLVGAVLLAEVAQGGHDLQLPKGVQMGVVLGHPKTREQVRKKVVNNDPRRLRCDADALRGFDHVAERKVLARHHTDGGELVLPVMKDDVAVVLHVADAGHQKGERVIARVPLHGDAKGHVKNVTRLPVALVQCWLAGGVAADDVLVLFVFDVVRQHQLATRLEDTSANAELQGVAVVGPCLAAEQAVGAPVGAEDFNGAGAWGVGWQFGLVGRCGLALRFVGAQDPVLVVGARDFWGSPKHAGLAFFEPEGALAQGFDGADVVAGEEQGHAVVEHAPHAAHALELEQGVAHRQRFVDDQDLRVHMHRHRERQAHIHAAGVGFDGAVDEVANVGKGDDVFGPVVDLPGREAQDGGVDGEVFAASEFGVEACAQLQQGGNAAAHLHLPSAWLERAAQQLQQGGLARTVGADDAKGFTTLQLEADALQRTEFAVVASTFARQRLQQSVVWPVVEAVGFGQAVGLNHPGLVVRGHRRSLGGFCGRPSR